MTSFLKYREDQHSNGRGQAHFGRASVDGIPFRGNSVPMLREEEFESLTERVNDGKVEIFDLSIPEKAAEWERVIDHIANGWYRVLHCDRKFVEAKGTWLIYIEYIVPWNEIPADKLHGRQFPTGQGG